MEADPVRDLLHRRRFVAFDTETTGLWAISNRLVEIAAIKFTLDDGQIDSFVSLINPQRAMPPEVIGIHGITDDMVLDADPAGPVLERFMAFCDPEDILIAHNAPFDISFVTCELRRAGMTFGPNLILDTVDVYRRYYPGQPSYSLLALAQSFAVAETQQHRALGDSELVHKLFVKAVPRLPEIMTVDDLRAALTVYSMIGIPDAKVSLPDRFADLSGAIDRGHRVEMLYAGAGQTSKRRIIRPLSVHEYNSTVYLNAFCELADAERTFRLDRIETFRVLDS